MTKAKVRPKRQESSTPAKPKVYGLPIPARLVDLVLLGPADDRRQLQDSPILGDVWMEYAVNSASVQDLLITPHKRSTAAKVAALIDERLRKHRAIAGNAREHPNDVAYLQGLVATELDLVELLVVVVPMTHWWSDRKISEAITKYRDPKQLTKMLLGLFKSIEEETAEQDRAYTEIPPLDRYLALAGLLLWARLETNSRPKRQLPLSAKRIQRLVLQDIDSLSEQLAMIYDQIQKQEKVSKGDDSEDTIFSVSLNRRVSPAIARSVPAVKGDAARSLFKVNTSKITWAVLDSGIDETHPAFRVDTPKPGQRNSRVVKTFDFTRMRKIVRISGDLKADAREIAADLGKPVPQIEAALDSIRRGAKADGKLNWQLIESVLELEKPATPLSSHGTHVAGIIGARQPAGNTELADGMCPDIQLYDFRVLAKTLKDTEFAVIAALQYIRYVNERHSYVTIHGANLSLSIPHNVRNYACGRTPVCNECQRLIESGVVVVAAAGNRGYQRFETKDGPFENYTAFSVTDPGNADDVITVGATHGNWPHTYGVSFFSSRGPTGDGRPKPDLVAPGERISAPIPGTGVGAESGTSMAAPHVSGAAAMLMARYPELVGNPRRIKRILCESATDLDRERSFQGHGMLDVLRAFQSI